jgi:SAM-dependent methyltransferase
VQDSTNRVDVWEREYRELHTIPSSTRLQPSKALLLMKPLFDLAANSKVLDAGCGNGRNAVYLASNGSTVIASDFAPTAISSVRTLSRNVGLEDRVFPARVDLADDFPFADGAFDCCLDSYVSCHFAQDVSFRRYWREITRVTRRRGYIFSSFFSTDDEYYQGLLRDKASRYQLVIDPNNGITKRIYDEEEFKSIFSSPLSIVYFTKFQFTDRVLGRDYRRSLLVVLLQKDNE